MRKKIMIVDDAMFMRKLIEKMLRGNGYEDIVQAANAEECLALYRQVQPDIILLDITMPQKNGLEVLDELLNENADAYVIMCSALGQEELIAAALRKGARDFIVKPFTEAQLLQVLAALGDQ
ncbi:response regulator [Erysipelotrichaceae bacterium AF15-26LB]|jgi:two-component system chemotaxis response regulator CheY|nr:response regulator [[Clostridium] innocuum]RJV89976.1 response regulator [Erysipelotrichaceae bacterium AF19-24AC]RJV90523.1 response regulator [Erysipelotrichaceae bacterium AF15-26LB]